MPFEFYWLNESHDADNFLVFIKTTRPENISAVRVCDANSGNTIFLFAATQKGQSTALNYSPIRLNTDTIIYATESSGSLKHSKMNFKRPVLENLNYEVWGEAWVKRARLSRD